MAIVLDEFIEDCLNAGLALTLSMPKEGHKRSGVTIEVPGFYKSGSVFLTKDSDCWIATDRYGKQTRIESLRDLADLNYDWWDGSRQRNPDWASPHGVWGEILQKYGLVTVASKRVYTPVK